MIDNTRSFYDWEPVIMLPDEHRLFPLRGNPFKWIAIADNSGAVPEATDDGVLWLDFDWNLLICAPDNVLAIPVKRQSDGERFSTVTNASTLLYLSSTFEWPIEDQFSRDNTKYIVRSQS